MARVLVVEDDELIRNYFSDSVSRCPQLTLVKAAATFAEAVHWLRLHGRQIDVLLTDLGLPDGNGLDLIRLAVQLNPDCEPLVVSMFGDEENVLASIEAGALGYIHKDSAPEDIAQAILAMRAGASPISPMIARRVLTKYRSSRNPLPAAVSSAPVDPAGRVTLTEREQEVLNLIARGFSYAEIANLAGLSVHTIQSHIKKLYSKLSVHSKSEAVFEADRMGLL